MEQLDQNKTHEVFKKIRKNIFEDIEMEFKEKIKKWESNTIQWFFDKIKLKSSYSNYVLFLDYVFSKKWQK